MDKKDVTHKFNQVQKEYPNIYTNNEKELIINEINRGEVGIPYNYLVREFYDELGLIRDENNIYIGFMDLIEKAHGLDKNIIEVAGGIFPRLSERIALKQKSGTISVYDPRLAYTSTDIPNMKLFKERFSSKKRYPNTDLFIGLEPYGATEAIIEAACLNNTDFIIALGDLPFTLEQYCEFLEDQDYDYLQSNLIYRTRNLINKYGLGKLVETNLEKYGSRYPVIYNKR